MNMTQEQSAYFADRVARAGIRANFGQVTAAQLEDLRGDLESFDDSGELVEDLQAVAKGTADVKALAEKAKEARPDGFDLAGFRASMAPVPDDATLASRQMAELLG